MKTDKRMLQFFAVTVLFNMAASFAHPVTPTIIKTRGFGDYMFGIALAAMMVVNFSFSPFWGRLISFLSSRRVILVCAMGYAVGQAIFGLASSELMMVGARMFAGVFIGGAMIGCLTYVINTAPVSMRGNYLTVMATIQSVAGAFGFFVGGMLGEIGIGVTMVAQVVTLASCGVLYFIVCKDDASIPMSQLKPEALLKEANPLAAFVAAKDLLTPLLIFLLLITCLSNIGSTAFDQSSNYYFKAQLGLSSGYNGAIKAVIGLVSLIANSTICLWLLRHTDIRRSSIYVYLLCSLATVGVLMTDSMVPFVVSLITYFGFFAVSVPLTQNLVANSSGGKDTNLLMGCYNGMKSLGGIFGALWAGLLYTQNPRYPFMLGSASFALATMAAAYYFYLSRRTEPVVAD
jgi:predicted MFS family arabinose efflux permease